MPKIETEKQTSEPYLLNAALSAISDFVYVFDRNGRFVFANQPLLDLLGITPDEIVGKNFHDLGYPEDLANRLQKQIEEVIETKKKIVDETSFESATGASGFYEYIFNPVFATDGAVGLVAGSTRDISARRQEKLYLAFLAELQKDLANYFSSAEIMRTAGRCVAEYLNLSHLLFVEIDEAASEANVFYDYCAADLVNLKGVYHLEDFHTVEERSRLASGKTAVINDVRAGRSAAAQKFENLNIASLITAPYLSQGRWKFALSAQCNVRREWKTDEIKLIEQLAERLYLRIERARAEEILRESESKYHRLFNTIDQGFCVIEMLYDDNGKPFDFRYLEINAAFEKQSGLVNATGRRLREFMPNYEDFWFETYGRVALTGEAVRFDDYSEAFDRWWDVYAFSAGEPGSNKVGVLFADITARKRAEAEREEMLGQLEIERSRLAYIFENAPAFVAVLSGDEHRYVLTNPAYQKLIGYRDVTGKTVREALPDLEKQGYFELLDKVYKTGEPFVGQASPVELRYQPNSPLEKRFVDFVFQPVFDGEQNVTGIFVHGVDITNQVEARQTAENANRLKDEFLATLSHELRTPLNAILGWSQMLQNGNLEADGIKKAIETIERSARSQNQLIDDLLDVSRIITGKLRLDVRALDLPDVIAAAIDAARPAAEAKNIHLQILLDPRAGYVSGDADRLQQVIWNLLSNAVKFTPKGGRIQVRLERVNSHIEIVVSDSGKGIESEFLPHVFDRFRQSDGSMTRRHGGLGLGLAIVRQLVELHGGSVSVESAGAGKGSTFRVCLPFLPVRVEPETEIRRVYASAIKAKADECPPLDGLKILVVDDDINSRELLEMILGSCGAIVTTAGCATEAFERFQTEKFSIVISDIGMPDEDGYTLISKIRQLPDEQGGNIPAIALTAYARTEDRVQALRSGFQMHVPKPVEHDELVIAVANLAGIYKKPERKVSE